MDSRVARAIRTTLLALLSSAVAAGAVSPAAAGAPGPPAVSTDPDIAVVAEPHGTASFNAEAAGTPAPTVQWQFARDRNGPWADIPGATATTLTVTASQDPQSEFALGNAFRAVFTNSEGTAISRPAKLVWRAEWMRDLGSEIADVPLNELTIPGAHDMGTYGINGDSAVSSDDQASDIGCFIAHAVCVSYATAQATDRDATNELDDGIRYFDLRICGTDDGQLRTCHGLEAADLQEILDQTRAWVDSHPYEVVFLDFNHHYVLDPDAEATQIEQAFALPNGGSLLIPPQYCPPPKSGTCAGLLTLHTIAAQHLGRVIANFENDDALESCVLYIGGLCVFYRQPLFGLAFYDRHPRFWGRTPSPPASVGGDGRGQCTPGAAVESCFGNNSDVGFVSDRVRTTLEQRDVYTNTDHFFVQFLQTTPDFGFIATHPDGSLLDMAGQSNPFIGPAVFRFELGQRRPENLNILALNFYNRTHYQSVDFDFVADVISFDEYARTAPVVKVSSLIRPASTGWYNAADLDPHGDKLQVDVRADDYRYATGIHDLSCLDSVGPTQTSFGGILPPFTTVSGSDFVTDGVHAFSCEAEDGARLGFHGRGNRGAGPGSTPAATFEVDTTPPEIHCPDAHLLLNQPGDLTASVTDATSGPAADTVSAPISTDHVGTFSAALSASDVAGNTTSASCPYTVSYGIGLRYDAAKAWKSGSVVRIAVELDDYFGKDVSDKAIAVTAQTVTDTDTGATVVPTSPGNQTLDFVSSAQEYHYDLKTTGYEPGSYTLDFVAGDDPVLHRAAFLIR